MSSQIDLPFKDRPYQVFISYSISDYEVVSNIANWFTRDAGISIFLDRNRLNAGAILGNTLSDEIQNSKNGMIVISKESLKSGWVSDEYNLMLSQRNKYPEYKIIPIKLDDSPMPGFIQTTLWVTIENKVVDANIIYQIINALYPSKGFVSSASKDIFVSRGWRPLEVDSANKICSYFIKAGFRLIGDNTDNKIFKPETRVKKIMESCGIALIIAPNRDGKTSPYIEIEIELIQNIGLDYIIIADDNVNIEEKYSAKSINQRCYRFSEFIDNEILVGDVLEDVRNLYKSPPYPHFSFFGTSLLRDDYDRERLKQLIEQVTASECIFGYELTGKHAQEEIIGRISNALFMIADISENNYNTYVEAGIARGSGTRLFLVCNGEPRPNRFMFRDLEVLYYQNETQLIGHIHKIAFLFRRRVINNESPFRLHFNF